MTHLSCFSHVRKKGVSLREKIKAINVGFPSCSLFHSVLCVTWNPQMFLQVKELVYMLDCFWLLYNLPHPLPVTDEAQTCFLHKSNTLNRVIIRLITHPWECAGSPGDCWGLIFLFFYFFTPVIICFLSSSFFNATDGLPGRPLGERPTPADWRKGWFVF